MENGVSNNGYQVTENIPGALTVAQINKLNYMAAQQSIFTQQEMAKMSAYHWFENQSKYLEYQIAERKLMKKEELLRDRKNITYDVYMDSQGYLCKTTISALGKPVSVKKISSTTNLRLTIFVNNNVTEDEYIYWLKWDSNPKGIYFSSEKWNPENVFTKLKKKGCVFQTSREYKKNLEDIIFAYLIKQSEKREIPYVYGWNRVDKYNWQFAYSNDITIRGLRGKYAE